MPVEPTASRPSPARDIRSAQTPRAGSRPASNTAKTPLACATCRKKKVKCSGAIPCQYCQKRGIKCVPRTAGSRRTYSDTQIEQLQARLARYERPDRALALSNDAHLVDNPVLVATPLRNTQELASPAQEHERLAQSGLGAVPATPLVPGPPVDTPSTVTSTATHTQRSKIASDSSLSSSHTFGSRIHTLLDHARAEEPLGASRVNPVRSTPLRNNATTQRSGRAENIRIPSLPTPQNALRLLEAVTFYIGQAQCHFDARELLDRISCLSESTFGPGELAKPEMLAALLVLAIGRLFVGEIDPSGEIPGTELFEFILGNFPSLGELYSLGRLGVEVTALVAVYMQNSNRREEAYIYISTALRLAISHGFHRESRLEKFAQSERVRLNRLWWTVYMQERRLAAATGNPSGINDEAIELPLPTNAPGFGPAAPLCTNIKIGRVVGRIISDLYGKEAEAEQTFVSNVQDIVQTLYDISQDIPSELDTSMRNFGSDLSLRTTAMLHLMLYQATLLTIRPIMLHVTQLILEGNISSSEDLSRTPLGKLTETCIEAARRMLKAIIVLKSKNMLVVFGFFDLESAVSAAIVMVLMTLYNSACPDQDRLHPTPGLNDALEVLQFLADKGNIFAFQRLQEARRLWELTRAFLQKGHAETNSHNSASELDHMPGFATGNRTNNYENSSCPPQWEIGSFQQPSTEENITDNAANDANVINMATLDNNLWDEISNIWTLRPDPEGIALAPGELVTNPLTEDAYRQYYALYNNGQGSFVGDDMEGLTDLGRYLFNSGT